MGCEAVATGHYARTERDPATGRAVLEEGRRRGQGPVVLPVRPVGGAARRGAVSGRRPDEGRGARARATRGPAHGRQGREPGDLLRSARERGPASSSPRQAPVAGSRAAPRVAARSRTPPGARRARTRVTSGTRSASGAASASPRPSDSTCCRSTRAANRVVVGPRHGARELAGGVGRPAALGRGAGRVRSAPASASGTAPPRRPRRSRPARTARAEVVFDAPVRAVTPGQSCVFYDGDVVLGRRSDPASTRPASVLVRLRVDRLRRRDAGKSDRISPYARS